MDANPPDSEEEATAKAEAHQKQQEALAARLKKESGAGNSGGSAGVPFGGALIKIDQTLYEPAQLRISTFAIKPYDGQIVAGQMLDAAIMLPSAADPVEITVRGVAKTLDEDFGLRVIFGSPQPFFQKMLADHLISLRKK